MVRVDKENEARRNRRGGGGRSGRLAMREAGPAQRPVRAGLPGGRYKPLTDRDLDMINEAALDILETLGIGEPTAEAIEIALANGAHLNEHNRICFPRSIVEEALKKSASSYTVHSRDPQHDNLIVGHNHVNYVTSGEAVTVYNAKEKNFRPSALKDLYDFCRVTDTLENIHGFGQTVVPTELDDPYEHDINVAYAIVSGTQKPAEMTFVDVKNIDAVVEMFDMVAGGVGKFKEKPFATFGGCPIVSPLRFGEDNLEVLIASSKRDLISDIAIAPQAGATAPAHLAGTLAQVTAEGLSCLCMVNMIAPGTPMSFAIWPFVSDLRSGSFSGGSGEEAVLMAAAAQIGGYYNLPVTVAASMTDAKMPDAQAGYEKGIASVLAGMAGANRVLESAGMLGSLMACSFEALLIDNDMLGQAQRAIRGIEVNEQTLSVETIKEACLGAGHFLGHPKTLECMETEYLYPKIADRQPFGQWVEEGSKSILDVAIVRAEEVLATHFPTHISEELDDAIRAKFPIKLDRSDMKPKV
ncbi:trimethylamine methyltransferase family protein [Curvivirga aplysinae]|uniref:trimethylamine methyltransferase family protein n=1 Tax=Curvivirga aplysinae TaxID=2529852 RepID=UPI0012BBDD38|nr:trimethylamine methyltransferase family protein [Curvivirga aplysinae]MTI10827.1 trimethylamine methyltransferase [Curvivirga aplysinae]